MARRRAETTPETARRLSRLPRDVTERLGSWTERCATCWQSYQRSPPISNGSARRSSPQHDRVTAIASALAILPPLAADLALVRETAESQHDRVGAIEQAIARLEHRLSALDGTLELLKGNVEDATEHLRDPDAP